MKTLLLFTCLALPATVWAQKGYTPLKEHYETRLLSKEKVGIYRALKDTLAKPSTSLGGNEEVVIIGQYNARWAVINKGGFEYFIPQVAVMGVPNLTVLQMEESQNTPPPIDPETHRISYQQVVELPGLTKAELYGRALEWVAKTYNSAQNVIQVQDKESGKIVLKALKRVSFKGYDAGVVNYMSSIYIKEGKYKYVFTDFTHDDKGAPGFISGGPLESTDLVLVPMRGKKPWETIRRQAFDEAIILSGSLSRAMKASGKKDPSDF